MAESCDELTGRFIGRELGPATILKKLNEKAGELVFLAFQRTLRRQVAVKVLLKSQKSAPIKKEWFEREARIVAGLAHPNIVPIFEIGEAEDCYFQVIQIVEGTDLASVIKNRLKHPIPARRLMPLKDAVGVVLKILNGLAYAHEEGVVHLDMKPANILLESRAGRPLIADFGIASILEGEIPKGIIVGSPLYMAPERISNRNRDKLADVYSMGILLFELLAGELPLREKTVKGILRLKKRDPDNLFLQKPSQVTPRLSPVYDQIIARATATTPQDRYRDCSLFAAALEKAVKV